MSLHSVFSMCTIIQIQILYDTLYILCSEQYDSYIQYIYKIQSHTMAIRLEKQFLSSSGCKTGFEHNIIILM